jgi:uncharacterized protein (TIGR02145 family)
MYIRTSILLLLAFTGSLTIAPANAQLIILRYTALQAGQRIEMDSILIQNTTLGCDTTLYYPDTALIIGATSTGHHALGIADGISLNAFPNPASGQVGIEVQIASEGPLEVSVGDLAGRRMAAWSGHAYPGILRFSFMTGMEHIYLLTARSEAGTVSQRIINIAKNRSVPAALHYEGSTPTVRERKSTTASGPFSIAAGHYMRCVAYKDSLATVLKMAMLNLSTDTFYFGIYTVCGLAPVVSYADRDYVTVDIGNQCWMAENLDIGTFISSVNTGTGHSDQTNNGITERYCYANDSNRCRIFGGLYEWGEAMAYSTTAGAQGICPPGWHIPTDAEWTTLINLLGGEANAGGLVKAGNAMYWNAPNTGADNLSGFNAYGAGSRWSAGTFNGIKNYAYFWSSTVQAGIYAWHRVARYNGGDFTRANAGHTAGESIRCLKNN